jgi:hypothetical protein
MTLKPLPVRITVVVSVVVATMAVACRPSQSENAQVSQRPASDSQTLVKPPHLGEVPPRTVATDSGQATSPRRPPASGSAGSRLGAIPVKARRDDMLASESLTVASFLSRPLSAGQRVQITGTCLDQFHASPSAGLPPVSRSDWQLTNGSQMVYVVGRMPTSCVPGPAAISAIVTIDTTLIGGQRRPRRFLTIPR